MKKILLFAVFILISINSTNVSYAAIDENLITNPSVEQKSGYSPVNWSHVKKGNNVSNFIYNTNGYDGSRSLSIKVFKYVAGESYWSFDAVPVVSEKTYIYSEYYKATMNTKLYAKVKRADSTEIIIPLKDVTPSSAWTNITVDITVPTNAKNITIVHSAIALGTLDTDNFSLIEKPPVATTTPPVVTGNPIPNSSLEIVSSNTALPLHWSKVKTGTNNAKFTYLNTGHTGNRSLNITITNYTNGLAYYRFDTAQVESSKTYDFSFYHKSDTYSEIDAEITLQNGDIVYQYLGVSYPSADWTKFSTRIRMPENAKTVSIYSILYSKGNITTDDYALSPVTIVPLERPIVSLTYDDFFDSSYETIFPMFKEYGFKGTMYITTKDLGTSGTLTPDKFHEMHDYGFEVGAHTVNHPHLPFLTTTESETEISQSKADIQNYLDITPKNFATPYGEYNEETKNQIKRHFRSHRSVDVGYNTKDNFDILNIKAMSTTNNTLPETVLGWVDEAIRDKAWLVLVYHDIVDGGGTWTNTPAHMQAVLDGIASRDISVKTIDQALDEIEPQI